MRTFAMILLVLTLIAALVWPAVCNMMMITGMAFFMPELIIIMILLAYYYSWCYLKPNKEN